MDVGMTPFMGSLGDSCGGLQALIPTPEAHPYLSACASMDAHCPALDHRAHDS